VWIVWQFGPVRVQVGVGQVLPWNVGQFGPLCVQVGAGQVLPWNVGQFGPLWVQVGAGQVLPWNVGQFGPLCVHTGPLPVHGSGHVFPAIVGHFRPTDVGHFGPASVHPSMIVPQIGPVTVCGNGGAASGCPAMMRPSRKLAFVRSATTGP
jgi:hypothetical protein